ncbi:MAG: alpha/beta hydrolase [Clostridia bacterium]|nr:alpha/beta hydrolase [Clostridia bacterium]
MDISRVLYSDARTAYEVTYTPDVVFAHRETGDLALQLLTPVPPDIPKPQHHALFAEINKGKKRPEPPKDPRVFPLIVDVPGSGWSGAEGYAHVPKMVELAKQGFVVASIAYRGTFKDDVRFPAAVQDTKEAIRFLRAHAAAYHIDPAHVTLLGDSSGGHTVAMASLTGDEERFNIGEHLDQPTAVNACVIFYGPNDLLNLVPDRLREGKHLRPGEGDLPFEARELFWNDILSAPNPQELLADASPINHIRPDAKLPAFLFLQGEEDPIIPMAQGLRFCDRVRECGGRAELIKIAAAGHGTGCWTAEAMELIAQFLKAYN